MLIDDDEPTNFLSRMIIEEADCTDHIQVIDGGESALKYLRDSKKSGYNSEQYPWPDLIFLDIFYIVCLIFIIWIERSC